MSQLAHFVLCCCLDWLARQVLAYEIVVSCVMIALHKFADHERLWDAFDHVTDYYRQVPTKLKCVDIELGCCVSTATGSGAFTKIDHKE